MPSSSASSWSASVTPSIPARSTQRSALLELIARDARQQEPARHVRLLRDPAGLHDRRHPLEQHRHLPAGSVGDQQQAHAQLGLRTDRTNIPSYRAENPGITFGFKDKLAPRLGFAYDIKGDSKWKAYGSWGMFYDIEKLEMPRGAWGADHWISYYWSMNRLQLARRSTATARPRAAARACSGAGGLPARLERCRQQSRRSQPQAL